MPAADSSTRRDPARIRVLLCDDTAEVLALMRIELGMHKDLEVVGDASDGARAIEAARALQPDVILLDLAMPVMDGLEALPGILKVAPQTRVIILSGFDASHLGSKAFALGASLYLEKGAEPWQIADSIRQVMSANGHP